MWQVIAIIVEDCHAKEIEKYSADYLSISEEQKFINGFNHGIDEVVVDGLYRGAGAEVIRAIDKVRGSTANKSNTSRYDSTWNSTFEMLEAALENRDRRVISDEDWDAIAELITVWSLFYKATDKASTCESLSYMEVISALNYLKICLTQWIKMYTSEGGTLSGVKLSEEQRGSFSLMCDIMLKELEKYIDNLKSSKILSTAALLYPNTKQEHIDSSFLPEVRAFIQSKLDTDEASCSTVLSLLEESDRMFDMEFVRSKGKQPSVQSASDELGDYLRSPHCKSKDALAWWKETGEDSYPKLAKIAKDFLCINFSSATSKHLF